MMKKAFIIGGFCILVLGAVLWYGTHSPEQRTDEAIEKALNDTLILEHSKIPGTNLPDPSYGYFKGDSPQTPPAAAVRYFLVSYTTMLKGSSDPIVGSCTITTWGGSFFRKTYLDSFVFESLARKRECYQAIVVTFVHEFETREDQAQYETGYIGNAPPVKHKAPCCGSFILDDSKIITGPSDDVSDTIFQDKANWRPVLSQIPLGGSSDLSHIDSFAFVIFGTGDNGFSKKTWDGPWVWPAITDSGAMINRLLDCIERDLKYQYQEERAKNWRDSL